MDRPTCATCRYFVATDSTGGRCVAMPPRVSGWPVVTDGDSCAVHPDFPAFIESRKAPAVNPGDAMYWDEHGQRCMRLTTPPTAPPSPPPTPRE